METTGISLNFEGHAVPCVRYQDRWAWPAAQVGAAIGYSRGSSVTRIVRTLSQAGNLEQGKDFEVVERGDEFEGTETVFADPKARTAYLLFESGLHGVLLHSRKPRGMELRRRLMEDVLPQLARDGRYSPDRAVVDGYLVEAPTARPWRELADAWLAGDDDQEEVGVALIRAFNAQVPIGTSCWYRSWLPGGTSEAVQIATLAWLGENEQPVVKLRGRRGCFAVTHIQLDPPPVAVQSMTASPSPCEPDRGLEHLERAAQVAEEAGAPPSLRFDLAIEAAAAAGLSVEHFRGALASDFDDEPTVRRPSITAQMVEVAAQLGDATPADRHRVRYERLHSGVLQELVRKPGRTRDALVKALDARPERFTVYQVIRDLVDAGELVETAGPGRAKLLALAVEGA